MKKAVQKKPTHNRRTYAQLFSDASKALGGDKQTLRDRLNWDGERYHRIRRELADQDKVVSGRGKGGSVMQGLPSFQRSSAFFSVFSSTGPLVFRIIDT